MCGVYSEEQHIVMETPLTYCTPPSLTPTSLYPNLLLPVRAAPQDLPLDDVEPVADEASAIRNSNDNITFSITLLIHMVFYCDSTRTCTCVYWPFGMVYRKKGFYLIRFHDARTSGYLFFSA